MPKPGCLSPTDYREGFESCGEKDRPRPPARAFCDAIVRNQLPGTSTVRVKVAFRGPLRSISKKKTDVRCLYENKKDHETADSTYLLRSVGRHNSTRVDEERKT